MPKERLVELLGWLLAPNEPLALFLPRERYLGLQSEWALPAL
jgi:hypothetical protein